MRKPHRFDDQFEYAGWLADKLHATNDYGKEAAALLITQAGEIAACRELIESVFASLDREVRLQGGLMTVQFESSKEAQASLDRVRKAWAFLHPDAD